jgi:27-O-demethylrifamycin SV methyltransferase
VNDTVQLGHEPAEHYDRVTGAWRLLLGEELHYGVFESGDEPLQVATAALTGQMVAAAELRPGLDVLDVGCGTGAPACALASAHGVHVVGITTSQVGVDAARLRAAGLAGRASFELRDGTDNGFADATFDRVWVLESSHLMPDRVALLCECARVLRPGGRLVLCDITRQREIPFQEVLRRRLEFATLRDAFGEARMEPLGYYAELAQRSGLDVQELRDLTQRTLPTFDRWRANAAEHDAEVRVALGADGLDAFVRSCDILEGFWRDGTLGYGLISAVKRDVV